MKEKELRSLSGETSQVLRLKKGVDQFSRQRNPFNATLNLSALKISSGNSRAVFAFERKGLDSKVLHTNEKVRNHAIGELEPDR